MVVRREFKDIENIIDEAVDIEVDGGVSFVTKYDNAALIIKELFGYEQFVPCFIQLSDPMWDGYDREFIISINDNKDVYCEKYYRNGRYLNSEDGIVFILPDCCEECVSHLHSADCDVGIFIDVDFENYDDTECDDITEPVNEIHLEFAVEPNILGYIFGFH